MAPTKKLTCSYSELVAARRCAFKHRLAWIEGYRKEPSPTSALTFGIAWHEIMNAYYCGLQNHLGGWREARKMLSLQPKELQPKLEWMLEGYAAHYGEERDWAVLATELPLVVRLPQLRPDLIINLKVKIDLVIMDKYGQIWVDDHKTCSGLPSKKNQVDPQLPLYMYAVNQSVDKRAQFMLPRYIERHAFGARYSYALKPPKIKDPDPHKPLEDRFRRQLVSHTDAEILAVACDAYEDLYTKYYQYEQFNSQSRNIKSDCSWDCDFESPCRASRKGFDVYEFLKDHKITTWRDAPKVPVTPQSEETPA